MDKKVDNIQRYSMIALAALLLFGTFVYGKNFDRCYDRVGMDNAKYADCALLDYRDKDRKLNRLYKQKIRHLAQRRRLQLEKSENIWWRYKDSKCKETANLDANRGSMLWRIEFYQCERSMTLRRIDFLNEFE